MAQGRVPFPIINFRIAMENSRYGNQNNKYSGIILFQIFITKIDSFQHLFFQPVLELIVFKIFRHPEIRLFLQV